VTCGHALVVDGGTAPHVCNLDRGHDGRHGYRLTPSLPPFVTWSREPHVVTVTTWAADRLAWRKPHKRSTYKSAKQAKAALDFSNERAR
jgi:hypothetical protein